MERIILLLLLVFYQITFSQKELNQTEKLTATCKVWGFLKYYHPNVAKGDFDWRNQLTEVLPKIEQAKTKEEFSSVLENWINSLGEIKKVEPIIESDTIKYFDKNFDLSWINKTKLFSKNFSEKLRFIEKNRFQGDQYYVGYLRAQNIFVKNEDFPKIYNYNKNLRLLAIFTYWNIIEYFFPYKYLMDQKWDVTLEKMLPDFIVEQNDDQFYLAMQKLTAKIDDSHNVFVKYRRNTSFYYLPIFGKIIDEKLIVTEILNPHITENYAVKVGDVITKINDKKIADHIAENKNLICTSNESRFLHDIVEPILSGSEENIKLEFLVDNKTITKNINWVDYDSNRYVLTHQKGYSAKKEKFKILSNNIGYVNMEVLKVQDIPNMIEKLNASKAIIFDLRNYPNGTYEGISNFLNSEEKKFAIYTRPILNYPGRFRWDDQGSSSGTQNKNNYKGKVVVLLNEESLSQSEWTAMCFQTAGNITIIGSQTAGADGNVTSLDYMPALHTSFSGLGVYYPDKRETQRVGIIPDIEIKPTIKGIQEGRDEVLERAVNFIETGK
ncbi:S41 family peptidase [Flavobacterium sp. H122]|uniref:S41 family peptidase n=1 Tax=Flavobacterium sp. H122 TaxID=2529860 RepID=UPI0010AB2B31|nr:S41 family peptidase [Flavobacterium sp. H122]